MTNPFIFDMFGCIRSDYDSHTPRIYFPFVLDRQNSPQHQTETVRSYVSSFILNSYFLILNS